PPLRLIDAGHVHLLARCIEVRRDGVVPRLAQELEMWNEERRPVRRECASRALDETEELRDVPRLLLHEGRVRFEVPREKLRAIEELEQERGGAELRGARGG